MCCHGIAVANIRTCSVKTLILAIQKTDLFSDRHIMKGKGKAIPIQAWTGSEGFRSLRLPEFLESRHMKVARLSAQRTGRF